MPSIFEHLMNLPLFKGVSLDRLTEIVGEIKFEFLKFEKGTQIVAAGEPCTHIVFVLSGKTRSSYHGGETRLTLEQRCTPPTVVAPEYLFGRYTDYPCSVVALEEVSVLRISKHDYIKILGRDEVFMFNYLNLLSLNTQKANMGLMSGSTGGIDRIIMILSMLTRPGSSEICLKTPATTLIEVFGSEAVEQMRRIGSAIVEVLPSELHVYDREKLLRLYY
ncbi:MAG: cyclic nucleotide-binding domain-containing protein [Muribaculaceae bacterium]|nr:cyclic nucleotide-binding domain-containing protein [Muribaculaceae bacterium]